MNGEFAEITESLRKCAMDSKENWNESRHPRSNDGKFTSGDGRGKKGGEGDEGKKRETNAPENGSVAPSKSVQRQIISEAFRITGGGLKEISEKGDGFIASVAVNNISFAQQKCRNLNAVLRKHKLVAKIIDPRNYGSMTINPVSSARDANPFI